MRCRVRGGRSAELWMLYEQQRGYSPQGMVSDRETDRERERGDREGPREGLREGLRERDDEYSGVLSGGLFDDGRRSSISERSFSLFEDDDSDGYTPRDLRNSGTRLNMDMDMDSIEADTGRGGGGGGGGREGGVMER